LGSRTAWGPAAQSEAGERHSEARDGGVRAADGAGGVRRRDGAVAAVAVAEAPADAGLSQGAGGVGCVPGLARHPRPRILEDTGVRCRV